MMKRGLIFLSVILISYSAYTQCTTLGQNPSTALPVCGTTTFIQNNVPICLGDSLYVPGCSGTSGAVYENKNPFWYKFTCYQSGTLSFVITPNNANEDYDWQLYDITGHNPDDIYTDLTLVVTGNWAGTYGNTGASASGVTFIQCASDPNSNEPTFARSPNLIQGHEYLLLVSHFSDTDQGYSLSFGGGSAVITDPLLPHLGNATASCDGKEVRIKLNKKMQCSSIAPDGSDFMINSALTSITSAGAPACNAGFDMDSLSLFLSNPLPAGNYTITIRDGVDLNTLLDNCDRKIPIGENIPVTVYPIIPTPMDSLIKPGCSPQVLELVFRKPIRCNSIAADGSDFSVTGPVVITVSSAAGSCNNGLTTKILVQLSAPIQKGGIYNITLKTGTDGNTILDECVQETPVGSTIAFTIKDTVNADFTYNILYDCKINRVQYQHDGSNGVNSWTWTFNNQQVNNAQNPVITYQDFSPTQTQLIVSNGICSDTQLRDIVFDNVLKADFESTSIVCPGDKAMIVEKSLGNIISWLWNFGNGNTSTLKDPPGQVYPVTNVTREVPVRLIIRNSFGCEDSLTRMIRVINNCFIAVPSAFTPNGDGLNDYLYPLNAYKAKDLSFSVYNRFGQRLFITADWTNKWDGNFKGQGADPGSYVWVLTYTNTDTNKRIEQKGTVILIR